MSKELSLYDEIFSEVEGSVEELKDGTDEDKLSALSLKFESKVPNLEQMCYIMEKVLLKKESDATVYAGFQRISRARNIWDRFRQIADNVDHVYVFGIDDDNLTPHPDIDFVYLDEEDRLSREWFLVINKPLGKSMMVAYDLDGFGVKEDEKSRNFKGAKTNNPRQVEKASELLEQFIENKL
ncbi:MAG: DICT sensory domain-containing protein [bacterium]